MKESKQEEKEKEKERFVQYQVKATFVMHVFPRNLKPQDLKTGAKSKTECIFFPRSRNPPEECAEKTSWLHCYNIFMENSLITAMRVGCYD